MNSRQHEPVRVLHATGEAVVGDISFVDAPAPWAVLYVHGFGSSRAGVKAQAIERACARRDWTFAAFDFRGHGESGGGLLQLRVSHLLEDLAGVRDELANLGIRHLYSVGSSMGGWAATWFSLRNPQTVPACVLLAPALDFPSARWLSLTEDEQRQWEETGRLRLRNQWLDVEVGYGLAEERDQYPREQLAAGLTQPLLIFHGVKDEVIPYQSSLTFVEQAAGPLVELRLFKVGDHQLHPFADAMADAACDFFAQHAPEPLHAGRSAASR
jgi:pimeloyl-ACP methyl ester carboxylesterase